MAASRVHSVPNRVPKDPLIGKELGGNHRAVYVRTRVHVPEACNVQLGIGSDDAVKAWLNGTVVHENGAARPFAWCEDTAEAALERGWNELLVKVTQGGGHWAGNVRIRAADGSVLSDLRVDAAPQ